MVVLFVVDGSSPIWTHVQAESLEQKHARLHSHDKRWCQHVPTMSDLTARRGTSNLIGDDCRMSKGFELRVLESPLFPTSLCGVLVFGSVSRRPPVRPSARPPARPPSTHNLLTHNLLTHNLTTHNLLTHTTCSHTTCPHTTCHHTTCSLTHILSSHNLQLAHTQLVHFAWQAWHLVTSTLTLRGRRGRRATYGTGPALVAHRVPKWRRGRRGSSRGRRGTWWHRLSLCVAGVALGDMDLHFA